VVCWPITLDREDQYWTVLYCLQVCLAQPLLLCMCKSVQYMTVQYRMNQ
jgi:hypothetical protein